MSQALFLNNCCILFAIFLSCYEKLYGNESGLWRKVAKKMRLSHGTYSLEIQDCLCEVTLNAWKSV